MTNPTAVNNPTTEEFSRALAEYQAKWPRDGYTNTRQRFIETYKLLREYYSGGQIVDVGIWPGDFTCTLAMLNFDVLGIDKNITRPISRVQNETGDYVLNGSTTLTEKCRLYGVKTAQCDIERDSLPLEDASTDFILFSGVMECLRVGMLHTVRDLYRVLKPGGRLLVTTSNLFSLKNRINCLLGRADFDGMEGPYQALSGDERTGHSGCFRTYAMSEVVDLLQRIGFRLLYRGYRQFVPKNCEKPALSFFGIRQRLRNRLAKLIKPWGNFLFLVATRDGSDSQTR